MRTQEYNDIPQEYLKIFLSWFKDKVESGALIIDYDRWGHSDDDDDGEETQTEPIRENIRSLPKTTFQYPKIINVFTYSPKTFESFLRQMMEVIDIEIISRQFTEYYCEVLCFMKSSEYTGEVKINWRQPHFEVANITHGDTAVIICDAPIWATVVSKIEQNHRKVCFI